MQTKMDFFHTVSLLLGGEELLLRLEKIQSSKYINDYTQIKCTLLTLIFHYIVILQNFLVFSKLTLISISRVW